MEIDGEDVEVVLEEDAENAAVVIGEGRERGEVGGEVGLRASCRPQKSGFGPADSVESTRYA